MIIFDLAGLYFNGYMVDYIRCWPVAAKFTPEQEAAYKKCYNTLMSALKAMKPGGTRADVCAQFPRCLDDEGTWTGPESIHSMGLATPEGLMATRGHSFEYPDVFEQNMYIIRSAGRERSHHRQGISTFYVVPVRGGSARGYASW
jgi:Xaa-Pro aminopeptidase